MNYTGTPNELGCQIINGDYSYYSPFVDIWTYNHYAQDPEKYVGQTNTYNNLRNSPPQILPPQLIKPLIYSESGSGDNCDRYISEIKGILLSPFTGAAGAGLPWAFNNTTGAYNNVADRHEFFNLQKNVATFFEGIPLDEEDWFPGTDVRNDKKADLLYLKKGTSGHKKAMGVVHNRTVNFYTYGDQTGPCDVVLSNFEDEYEDAKNVPPGNLSWNYLEIDGMGTHNYAIQWYNPFTNQTYPVIYQWSILGTLTLPYPILQSNLDHSMLYFKVWKWNQSFLPEQIRENGKDQNIAAFDSNPNAMGQIDVIEDGDQVKNMTVHPNPANNNCTVILNGVYGENTSILILDAVGAVINEIAVKNNEIVVDLTHYANGLYTICLVDDYRCDFVKLIKE